MKEIFESDEIEGLIRVDANNAFNSINRNALLHNIKVLCPEIATFIWNCYGKPARLFVVGGLEISSSEGIIQGDPIAMPIYAIGIIGPSNLTGTVKHEAFADDLTGAGKIKIYESMVGSDRYTWYHSWLYC